MANKDHKNILINELKTTFGNRIEVRSNPVICTVDNCVRVYINSCIKKKLSESHVFGLAESVLISKFKRDQELNKYRDYVLFMCLCEESNSQMYYLIDAYFLISSVIPNCRLIGTEYKVHIHGDPYVEQWIGEDQSNNKKNTLELYKVNFNVFLYVPMDHSDIHALVVKIEDAIKSLREDQEYRQKEKELVGITEMRTIDLESRQHEEEHFEGKQLERYITYYERDPKLSAKAILIHGTKCKACNFDFEKKYGERGKGFIEVHHLKPVSELGGTNVDPETDLTVVCSNCHRMIHRKKNDVLSLEELNKIIQSDYLE